MPAFFPGGRPRTGDIAFGASAAALLLIFVFGGFDVISVPAGETIDPRRQVPFAFITTILVVSAVFTLAQAVCMAVLPSPAASTTP